MDQSTQGTSRNRPDAGEAARGAAEKARESASDMAGQARREAAEAAEKQRHTAADQTRGFADALRRTAEQLDRQQQSFLARCVNSCATNLDGMANSLRDKDVNALVGQTQSFARRQPGMFLGGAVATGFLLARFLKSSNERHHTDSGHSASSSPRSQASPGRGPAPATEGPSVGAGFPTAEDSATSEVDPHAR